HCLDLVAKRKEIFFRFLKIHPAQSVYFELLTHHNVAEGSTKMKSFFRIIFSVIASFGLTQIVTPQTSAVQASNSLLYEISRKDLAKPSYIFGTIHAICPADMIPVEGLTSYVDKSDQLLMEIDLDDPLEIGSMAKVLMIPGGKTIKDFLTTEQFQKVDEMTRSLLGYPAENVKTIKPTLLSVMIMSSPKAIGCTPSAYDVSLMQMAVAKKKPIVGLETVELQMKVLDSKPLDVQAKDLYAMSLDPQKYIRDFQALTSIYKEQDAEKLFERSTTATPGDKEFQVKLLDERNNAWIPKIESAIKGNATFIAVGAAHLGGKVGIIKLLRSKGYSLRPIRLAPRAADGN
ncbi:MAG: TraB/GumN family protein, partial [Pyrinomonadaceae bacterium]